MVEWAFFVLWKKTSHHQQGFCLTTSSIFLLMKIKCNSIWSAACIQSHHQSSRFLRLSSRSIRHWVLPTSHRCYFGKEKTHEDDNRHGLRKEVPAQYSLSPEEDIRRWSYGLLVKWRRKNDLPRQNQWFLEWIGAGSRRQDHEDGNSPVHLNLQLRPKGVKEQSEQIVWLGHEQRTYLLSKHTHEVRM